MPSDEGMSMKLFQHRFYGICFIMLMLHGCLIENVFAQDSTLVVLDHIEIDSVWVANKVSFDLHTVGNRQFVAYYGKNRMMTVASRTLDSDIWQKKMLPSKLMWDSHNSVAMGIDDLGCQARHVGKFNT